MKVFTAIGMLLLGSYCSARLSAETKWQVNIAKKANPVTGFRTMSVGKVGEGFGQAFLLIAGCLDNKPILRFQESFKIANGIHDALDKSPLQRSLEKKGPESEKHGFAYTVEEGKLMVRFKWRFDDDEIFHDYLVPMAYVDGVYVGILDHLAGEVTRRIRKAQKVIVEVPHKEKPAFVTVQLAGAATPFATLEQAGCSIP